MARLESPKMKKFFLLLPLVSLLCGCSVLLPKKVEFFQDKVQKFPELSNHERELQRQAAALAEQRANDTLNAALANHVPEPVLQPAKDTVDLTHAVATSLGPPSDIWTGAAKKLADRLTENIADFNSRVNRFKINSNENVGKKIEDTGIFKIGYLSMWGIILGLAALVWFGFKVYGMFNPAVALGQNLVGRVSSAVLHKGFTQIVSAGEEFKDSLQNSQLTEEVKEQVKAMFRAAQESKQDEKIQDVVKGLTK
jgi:hypothetical protein